MLAQRFNHEMEMRPDETGFTEESHAQHGVVLEEFMEYREAYDENDMGEVVEEMADVLVTLFVQADRMGIDIGRAYNEKMEYNLTKSGIRNDAGKIIDDVDVNKPDFSDERFMKR